MYLIITSVCKYLCSISAESRALPKERKDGWHKVGDEEINDEIENAAKIARVQTAMPFTQKAIIKFGYEEGMKTALGDEDFDTYIAGVFTHTQAHFRHFASLGTTIEFEVPLYYTFRPN